MEMFETSTLFSKVITNQEIACISDVPFLVYLEHLQSMIRHAMGLSEKLTHPKSDTLSPCLALKNHYFGGYSSFSDVDLLNRQQGVLLLASFPAKNGTPRPHRKMVVRQNWTIHSEGRFWGVEWWIFVISRQSFSTM